MILTNIIVHCKIFSNSYILLQTTFRIDFKAQSTYLLHESLTGFINLDLSLANSLLFTVFICFTIQLGIDFNVQSPPSPSATSQSENVCSASNVKHDGPVYRNKTLLGGMKAGNFSYLGKAK